jgi:hypothetical protein
MATLNEAADIKRTEIDWGAVKKFNTEEQFMEVCVSLVIEVASYVCLAAGTTGQERTWDRNQACIGGNMVRLYKLLNAFLDQTCQRRLEITFLLARLIFECVVNIKYLVENYSPELIESYVSYSLRHERRQRNSIESNIASRNGIILPIEDRMFKSIDRAVRAAGITLTDINLNNKKPWGGKNFYERTKAVGLDQLYSAAFGGGSHIIHGNWQDLYGNHLEWDEQTNRFSPKLKFTRPRPQYLTTIALVVIQVVPMYFTFMGGEGVGEHFATLLEDLDSRVTRLVHAHEAYLGGKSWPEI